MSDEKTNHDFNKLNILADDSKIWDDIELRLNEVKQRTSEFVKTYPLTSVAIAFGFGYIVAKFVKGKK